MTLQRRNKSVSRREKLFRVATTSFVSIILTACASISSSGGKQWAAHGFYSENQIDEPELIGVFDRLADCKSAPDAWEASQVVSQPVSADCFPVDRR